MRSLYFFCASCLLVVGSTALESTESAAPVAWQSSQPPANVSAPHQLAVTGCLRRDSNGGYSITDQNGKTWELVPGSSDIDLSRQIFHVVEVTGKAGPIAKPPQSQTPPDNSGTQAPPRVKLQVLTLEVLSNSCTR
jgi:hypothetical protein